MKADWEEIKKTLRSCLKAFKTADLLWTITALWRVARIFLVSLHECEKWGHKARFGDIWSSWDYQHMMNLVQMLCDIESRDLNIDIEPIKHLLSSVKGKNFHRTLRTSRWVCDYNAWGTVTGRLSTKPKSFSILTMGKSFVRVLSRIMTGFRIGFQCGRASTLRRCEGRTTRKGDHEQLAWTISDPSWLGKSEDLHIRTAVF